MAVPLLVVAFAPAMGVDMLNFKKVSSTTASSNGTMALAESEKSDAVSSQNTNNLINNSFAGADKESLSQNFDRTLSGSRLNANAPEFVPKSIVRPSSVTSGSAVSLSGLISGKSLLIPGLLPVQFTQEGFSVRVSSASSAHAHPHPHPHPQAYAPHPKPVITEELKAKIVKQVEVYFSDQNLPTGHHLMKLVRRDPEGFVPINTLASFQKIKNLVKSKGVVAAALRNSTLLVVSDDGKKVRRAHPLPDFDVEEVQSRTVVAENLPEGHSLESVQQLFSSVGNVKMVRIRQSEAANGASQTAAKFKSDMVISNKLHALVEFETIEQAEKAVAVTDQGNWRSGLHLRLLLRRAFQSKHGLQRAPLHKGPTKAGEEESAQDDETGMEDNTGDPGDFGQNYGRGEEAPGNGTAGRVERDGVGKQGKGRSHGRVMAGPSKGQHGGFHHIGSNGSRNHQTGTSPATTHILMASEVVSKRPPGPRMPDGTRGFTSGRGKLPTYGIGSQICGL